MPTRNEGIHFVLTVRDDGSAVINKFSGSFDKLDDALDQAAKNQKKWRQEAERSTRAGDALSGAVKKLIAAFISYKAAQWAKDTALLAARYETLGVVLEQVGKNVGVNTQQLKQFQDGLQAAGISLIQSRSTLIRMIQANIDLSKSFDLARVAQNAAVIGNVNSSEAFGRLIYGIQSAQIEVLRTIGINVNFENSYKKLSKEIGKNTDQLSEAEKVNARMNAVLDAGKNILGAYESAMNTSGKQLLSWERYLEDARVTLGEAFKPATNEIIMGMVRVTKELAEVFKDPQFQNSIINIAEGIGNVVKALAELSKYAGLRSITNTWNQIIELNRRGEISAQQFTQLTNAGYIERQRLLDEILNKQKEVLKNELEAAARISGASKPSETPFTPYRYNPGGSNEPAKTIIDISNEIRKVDSELKKFFDDLDKQTGEIRSRLFKGIDDALTIFYYDIDNIGIAMRGVDEALKDFFYDIDNFETAMKPIDMALEDFFRPIDQAEEKFRNFFKKTIDLSQHTAEAMSDSFSDFFFDVFTNQLDTLGDYVNSFLNSIYRSISQVLGQRVTEGILTSIPKIFSAKGNVFEGSGIGAFENQIVSTPKVFAFAKGIGVIGEGQKPEAVLPLARTSSGDLGVQTVGNNSGIKSIDLRLHNESGQPLKITQTKQRIDMQSLILDVVMDGANRNVNGFADAMGIRR